MLPLLQLRTVHSISLSAWPPRDQTEPIAPSERAQQVLHSYSSAVLNTLEAVRRQLRGPPDPSTHARLKGTWLDPSRVVPIQQKDGLENGEGMRTASGSRT